jgi:hypothetical protein
MIDLLIVAGHLRLLRREIAASAGDEDPHVGVLMDKLAGRLRELAIFAEEIDAKRTLYRRQAATAVERVRRAGIILGLALLALACDGARGPATLTTRDSLGNTFKLTVSGGACVRRGDSLVCRKVELGNGKRGTVTVQPSR